MHRMTLLRLFLGALAALAVAAWAGCGGEDEGPQEADDRSAPGAPREAGPAAGRRGGPAAEPDEDAGPPARKPRREAGSAEGAEAERRSAALERDAAATVRAYVSALDSRDGERVCALLAPGAIESVELPLPRRGCAASIEASIGYRDPRGLPVWKSAEVLEVRSVKIDGSDATVVATVLTRFADRAEPSIEDDIVHLTRAGGRWLLAKPSATLYRAVGVADVPPVVLAPPRERS